MVTIMNYGDPIAEHKNTREHVGIIDLSFIGKLKLTGKDVLTYLHNRLSNSIETLKHGQGCYATLLDFKGRMISDMKVYRCSDCVLMLTSPDSKDELLANFKKFIFSEDVVIEDISDKYGLLSVQGPQAKILIERAISPSLEKLEVYGNVEREMEGHKVYILKTDWSGEDGYHLVVPKENTENVWNLLLDKGQDIQVKPFGLTAFNSLRLDNGIPLWGQDMNQENIPLEANLQRAISYTKGCYPGQEIIAKITNLSHPWRILVGLEIQSKTPVPNHSILQQNGEEIGQLTSNAYSPTLDKIIGLGYVKWEYREVGTKVEIESGGSVISAVIKALPFYTRS